MSTTVAQRVPRSATSRLCSQELKRDLALPAQPAPQSREAEQTSHMQSCRDASLIYLFDN